MNEKRESPDGYTSKEGQDRWVMEEILAGRKNGFFVELGALDGIFNSNTLSLERDHGWSGICIEPNPRQFTHLLKHRNCHCVMACADSSRGWIDFRMAWVFGGIVAGDTDQNRAAKGERIEQAEKAREVFPMPSVPLTEILDACKAPREIDYLSLDVEGAEERVLRGVDFTRYRFGCMTIERPTPGINELLAKNGYQFERLLGADGCFVWRGAENGSPADEWKSWPAWDLIEGNKIRL